MTEVWKMCSSCKKEIPCSAPFYVCSQSHCRGKISGEVFCSVGCWTGHNEMLRHRDAWAEESMAPARAELQSADLPRTDLPRRVTIVNTDKKPSPMSINEPFSANNPSPETEILVVVSKVKQYIRERSDFNTSANAMDVLTKRIVQICDGAIRNANLDGRKTVMDRDVPAINLVEKNDLS